MHGAVVIISAVAVCCVAQRSPYAGRRPIGYPELVTTTTTVDPLGNRFGVAASTEKLPIEALGDRELVNRLSKLPIDQQPFWLLNWKHLEAFRKNPQTWQQNPNVFIERIGLSNQGPRIPPLSNLTPTASENRFGGTQNMDDNSDAGKRRYDEDITPNNSDDDEHGDKKDTLKKHDSLSLYKGSH